MLIEIPLLIRQNEAQLLRSLIGLLSIDSTYMLKSSLPKAGQDAPPTETEYDVQDR